MAKPSYATRMGVEALGTFGFFFMGFMGIAASVEMGGLLANGFPEPAIV